MSKLPIWSDLLHEALPAPTDIETDNPGPFTVSEDGMTPAQMKKRENIVKSMKGKASEFKNRYGNRWKEVMYATATKMAMEDTGTALDRIPHGGPAGFGAGDRDVQSEQVTRIIKSFGMSEALTFDVSSEGTEPNTDADTKTDAPIDKKAKPEPIKTEPKAKAEPAAAESTDAYVLYRYNPTLGWSPHFINPAKDGALESPVYSTVDDAKKAYRRNASQSPKTISFRVRKVTAQQGMKIHTKFEEMGKTLGYDTIKEGKGDENADPVIARMRVKAAVAIAHALTQGKAVDGDTPAEVLNAALRVWAKSEQTPETLRVTAEMLRTATRMGIDWNKKIVGTKLKDYLGEAAPLVGRPLSPTTSAAPPQARSMTKAADSLGNVPLVGAVPQQAQPRPNNQQQSTTLGKVKEAAATQTHWSQRWQYGADAPVKRFQNWKTVCGKLVSDKEMASEPTCPQCAAAAEKEEMPNI